MFLPTDKYDIHAIWWFWGPWLFAVFLFGLHAFYRSMGLDHDTYWMIFYSEHPLAIVEGLQTWIIFAAAILAAVILVKNRKILPLWLKVWLGAALLGSTYCFLEEISYGQHFFGWESSEFWEAVNDQGETNLHNTSSWLDQKPRLLLEIGVITGGIIIPWLKYYDVGALPQKFDIIYPSGAFFWIAMLSVFIHATDILMDLYRDGHEWVPGPFRKLLVGRPSEVLETYYYYFVLLYLIEFRKKLQSQASA